MKKSLLTILCAFAICTTAGCSNNSIESKLKKNGFEIDFKEKAVTFTKDAESQLIFRYSLSDDESETDKEIFDFFVVTDEGEVTIYFILENLYTTTGKTDNIDDGCVLYLNNSQDNDCSVANLKAIEEAKDKYSDIINDLGVTEKDLYEYMKELYNENFV